jgi:hypothetical protein
MNYANISIINPVKKSMIASREIFGKGNFE